MFGHLPAHPPFHRVVEVLQSEAKRTRRLGQRAEDGLENEGPRVREQQRQVGEDLFCTKIHHLLILVKID